MNLITMPNDSWYLQKFSTYCFDSDHIQSMSVLPWKLCFECRSHLLGYWIKSQRGWSVKICGAWHWTYKEWLLDEMWWVLKGICWTKSWLPCTVKPLPKSLDNGKKWFEIQLINHCEALERGNFIYWSHLEIKSTRTHFHERMMNRRYMP